MFSQKFNRKIFYPNIEGQNETSKALMAGGIDKIGLYPDENASSEFGMRQMASLIQQMDDDDKQDEHPDTGETITKNESLNVDDKLAWS